MYAGLSIYYSLVYQPSNPYLISTTRNVTSTSYSNEQLTFTVSASSGQTSTTKIYCGSLQKPESIYGLTSTGTWTYDDSAKILTITDTHSSSLTFTVSWSGSASGKYILDIYVQRDFLPTLATVEILGENKSTDLLGKTSWKLPYGTYTITAYQGVDKQSITLLLNGDTSKTFNFLTPPLSPSYGNPISWLALIRIAISVTVFYLRVFKRRK